MELKGPIKGVPVSEGAKLRALSLSDLSSVVTVKRVGGEASTLSSNAVCELLLIDSKDVDPSDTLTDSSKLEEGATKVGNASPFDLLAE